MHLEHLSLADFRSYAAAEVELGPGVTVFLGGNGNGKTNLLEAVGYLGSLASHRVAGDGPLVRTGAERAVIRARVRRGDRVATTDVEISPGTALRVHVNRAPVPRPRRSPPLLRSVVFAPEDIGVVKGDPDRRRRFLDDLVVTRAPRLAGVRADYDRVVRQRTALLKSIRAASAAARPAVTEALGVWDEHLAEAGAEIVHARAQTLQALAPHATRAYDEVSGSSGPLRLAYLPRGVAGLDRVPDSTDEIRREMLRAVAERRLDEIDRGTCLVGPHRDDVDLSVRDLAVRGYASHGESWSVALALRLASVDLLRDPDDPSLEPVLLLDDVFAELDATRRAHLAERASRAEQALVSVAAAEDLPTGLVGRLVRVHRDPVSGCSTAVPAVADAVELSSVLPEADPPPDSDGDR